MTISVHRSLALATAMLISSGLHAQNVVSIHDHNVVLSSGSDQGVREGMSGQICVRETVGGKPMKTCSARFLVVSVSSKRSIARITRGEATVASGAIAEFDQKLRASAPVPKAKRSEDETSLREADRAFESADYRGALERYQSFLRAYPHHEKASYAIGRTDECFRKLVPIDGLIVQPAKGPEIVPPVTSIEGTGKALTVAIVEPIVPAEVQQAEKLARTAREFFQRGQVAEARASALDALRIDSTNSRARGTLHDAQMKLVQSRFNGPTDLALAGDDCYVADAGNNTLRLIRKSTSATVAGIAGQHGFSDGLPLRARFNEPNGIAAALDGTLLIADRLNASVRRMARDGTITTVAGRSGTTGAADGLPSSARFNGPRRLAVAPDGTIYVSDTDNHAVRRILPAGRVETVVTLAGSDRMDPVGLAIDAEGNLLVADAWSHVIRKIDRSGHVSVAAGVPGVSGSRDGPVGAASFNAPEGIAIDSDGAIYVADTANDTIRKIARGAVTTVAGKAGLADAVDGLGQEARLNHPSGIRCDAQGRLWIVDSGNQIVRLMTAGFVDTVAGLAGSTGSSDGTN